MIANKYLSKVEKILLYRVSDKRDTEISCYKFPIKKRSLLKSIYKAAHQPKNWDRQYEVSQRVVADLIIQGRVNPFYVKYYYLGPEGSGECLASFFVYSDDNPPKPLFSGYLDYPNTVSRKRMESFFPKLKSLEVWKKWAHQAYISVHKITPLLRYTDEKHSYVCMHTDAHIYPYPEGYAIGGIPFGTEKQMLALADISDCEQWKLALDKYGSIFRRWNLICQSKSLDRVFIVGQPGAGKELWYEAIKGGVLNRMSGDWIAVSAALRHDELTGLLYGQREGNLERRGILSLCEGGGIFIDELGKSSEAFRNGLLRVLESQEFIPRGGEPKKFKNILFIFASTPSDKKRAFAPPDLWTRMNLEISLPEPIKLSLNEEEPLSNVDRSRFFSVFARFWFETLKSRFDIFNDATVDPIRIKRNFDQEIFSPLTKGLKNELRNWRSNQQKDCQLPQALPISPRRIKILATTLAGEYRWTGSAKKNSDATTLFKSIKDELTRNFIIQLCEDYENHKRLEELMNSTRSNS